MRVGLSKSTGYYDIDGIANCSRPAFVFITGHVLSGVGKGTVASSLGLNLRAHGFRVSAAKIDPYLNKDSGTMSPHEHGECYVLGDGMECDLDLGNYERFIGIDLKRENSITTGQVYDEVMRRERAGAYLGKTVQIIPHITDHIQERILQAAEVEVVGGPSNTLGKPEIVIVELGGTVGDMESLPFLHTLSHFERKTGARVCFISVGLVVKNNGELKTKPLQRSISELNSKGIQPDALVVRCDVESDEFPLDLREKIASSCNVAQDSIVVSGKVRSIYDVPKLLFEQRLPDLVCRKLNLLWRGTLQPDWRGYKKILHHLDTQHEFEVVRVAIVAKYTGTPDTYLSLTRALEHASFAAGVCLEYSFLDAETLEGDDPPQLAESFDRVLVPGGFGDRGIEGKMEAIRQARRGKLPYLGICLGMQLFVIDHCRTVLGWTGANSTEFDSDTPHPVVEHLSSYGEDFVEQLGGTMRLGNQRMKVSPKTRAYEAYTKYPGRTEREVERHRHRFEVSKYFVDNHEKIVISAWSDTLPELKIPEMVESEADDDWWAVACQFHPELVSRNDRPHPLFWAFLKA